MNRLIMLLATGFYAGRLSPAPGTWGSLAAFIPWFFLRELALIPYLLMLVAVFVLGFLVAGSAEKLLDSPDAGCIVIDEILGMFIALLFVPNHPAAWGLAFLLFRLFDIYKPFPVNWCDSKLHGGIGIMMDDVIAGLYALICLQLLWRLF